MPAVPGGVSVINAENSRRPIPADVPEEVWFSADSESDAGRAIKASPMPVAIPDAGVADGLPDLADKSGTPGLLTVLASERSVEVVVIARLSSLTPLMRGTDAVGPVAAASVTAGIKSRSAAKGLISDEPNRPK